MKRKRFSVEQITGILKQAGLGTPIAHLRRQHGVSEQSYYSRKKLYGGMEPSEGRELRELSEKNIKLKRLGNGLCCRSVGRRPGDSDTDDHRPDASRVSSRNCASRTAMAVTSSSSRRSRKPSLILLDDWGLTALSNQDRADLLEIVDDRVNTGFDSNGMPFA
jgi:putative transposase